VNFLNPDSAFIHAGVTIGRDTTIYPNVHLEGRTKIGRGVTIFPNVRILDGEIGAGVVIKDSTVIEDSKVKDRASVGPFAHLRPGSDVGAEARVGNFVELKKAVLGRASKASHLSYLGDAVIGRGVNIGAGTITCNYDGVKKHTTFLGNGVFVGSDTQLVAPVTIGRGAYIGAGSTITKDVPAGALALSRTAQKNIRGWANRRSPKAKSKK
jgi:bifunctional UDP-N-acetylglucosamine pyrophosphorylase/glucosamine-1-phosphate N-acetyltransferase